MVRHIEHVWCRPQMEISSSVLGARPGYYLSVRPRVPCQIASRVQVVCAQDRKSQPRNQGISPVLGCYIVYSLDPANLDPAP